MGNHVGIEVTQFLAVDEQGNETETRWGFRIWDDHSHTYATGFESPGEVYDAIRSDVFEALTKLYSHDEARYSREIREQGEFWLNGDFVGI